MDLLMKYDLIFKKKRGLILIKMINIIYINKGSNKYLNLD